MRKWPAATLRCGLLGVVAWFSGCAGSTNTTGTLPPVEDLRGPPSSATQGVDRPPSGVEVGSIDRGPEFVPAPVPAEELATPVSESPNVEVSGQTDSSPAVATLLDSAGRHANAGELDKAAAALERALRIDPRNAGVWHDLGQVRYHQAEYQQAEALAKRSNSLAADNRELRGRNWGLIERSRRARGDLAGADAAGAQARNP